MIHLKNERNAPNRGCPLLCIGGKEIVLTRSGLPLVKLVALTGQKRKRRFGSAKGLIKISDDFDEPLDDFRDYM